MCAILKVVRDGVSKIKNSVRMKSNCGEIFDRGLSKESVEALVPRVPNYCARKFWNKLSTSLPAIL